MSQVTTSVSTIVLEAVHVSKYFEKPVPTPILKDVSLSICQGEFVAIVGPSGSGKSTLLYLLGALDTPSEGLIRIGTENVATVSEKQRTLLRQRKVGFVFQFHFLLSEFSALENVALPGLLGTKPPEQVWQLAKELLDKVGLSHRLNHLPSQLSGGEQQRVAMARALIQQPCILLADEPTGNLDSDNSETVFALLKTLNRTENQAIVMVTHNMALAKQADRMIQLVDGQVV